MVTDVTPEIECVVVMFFKILRAEGTKGTESGSLRGVWISYPISPALGPCLIRVVPYPVLNV